MSLPPNPSPLFPTADPIPYVIPEYQRSWNYAADSLQDFHQAWWGRKLSLTISSTRTRHPPKQSQFPQTYET
ncbi:hypothetical protein GYMLUDRAFT_74596 [Collybiopsis luxurians FD-317 M1]|uniref:Uncharacterized protein n=1 Tax=Collybiopsis luxurians FD-317 M1 TaxID=944289 RepID=A0A0D0CLG2_9AGAR|nr:hypothetical protein GYMLUDRAFT_74596 [Collybiopsis luxurians FD-317 M1]